MDDICRLGCPKQFWTLASSFFQFPWGPNRMSFTCASHGWCRLRVIPLARAPYVYCYENGVLLKQENGDVRASVGTQQNLGPGADETVESFEMKFILTDKRKIHARQFTFFVPVTDMGKVQTTQCKAILRGAIALPWDLLSTCKRSLSPLALSI